MLALAISPFAIAILAVKTNIDLLTVSMLKKSINRWSCHSNNSADGQNRV